MTVSLEEELRAGIVVLVVLICLKVFQNCLLLGLVVCTSGMQLHHPSV